jgi:hypothetical protein
MIQTKYRDLRSAFGPKKLIPLIGGDLSLVEQWLAYSEDKRTNGGWYVTRRGEIGRVGMPETQIRYSSIVEAIAEYVVLELDFWAAIRHES